MVAAASRQRNVLLFCIYGHPGCVCGAGVSVSVHVSTVYANVDGRLPDAKNRVQQPLLFAHSRLFAHVAGSGPSLRVSGCETKTLVKATPHARMVSLDDDCANGHRLLLRHYGQTLSRLAQRKIHIVTAATP